mgnify:CR=1 FL=1
MIAHPTLIVVAHRPADTSEHAKAAQVHDWRHLQALAETGVQSGLPTLCVIPASLGPLPVALPALCTVLEHRAQPAWAIEPGIAQAVQATANSPGWLILPSQGAIPSCATIHAVAEALKTNPMAAPSVRGLRACPLGFGPEFYSELIRLQEWGGLDRLLARYPHVDVSMDLLQSSTLPSTMQHH